MERTEIRIVGLGGQGVVLATHIVGKACAIQAGHNASMLQSFGPEARGSACTATLVVDSDEVLYPYVRQPRYLVVMSGEGCDKYQPELAPDGVLVHEAELVTPGPLLPGQRAYAVPSTRIAEEIGRSIVQNIVMIGFFAAVSGIVTREEMEEAVTSSVPGGTEALNLRAFEAGWSWFQDHYATAGAASTARREAS